MVSPNYVDVMGSRYAIICNEELFDKDAECDYSTREIRICSSLFNKSRDNELRNRKVYIEKVLRHEIIHAFHLECGLEQFTSNEQSVDWFAHQFYNIYNAIESLNIVVNYKNEEDNRGANE